jgi:hypothetical protein
VPFAPDGSCACLGGKCAVGCRVVDADVLCVCAGSCDADCGTKGRLRGGSMSSRGLYGMWWYGDGACGRYSHTFGVEENFRSTTTTQRNDK